MANDIIQFSPGGKVTAEETNENNLLLKEWALDNSQSEAYIDGKIATLTSNLNSQISSINTQIGNCVKTSGNQTVAGKKYFTAYEDDNTPITTVKISKKEKGYLKMGNGLIIQWGYYSGQINNNTVEVSLPVAFSNKTYCLLRTNHTTVTGSSKYGGANPAMSYYTKETSKFKVWGFYDDFNKGFSWLAVGY